MSAYSGRRSHRSQRGRRGSSSRETKPITYGASSPTSDASNQTAWRSFTTSRTAVSVAHATPGRVRLDSPSSAPPSSSSADGFEPGSEPASVPPASDDASLWSVEEATDISSSSRSRFAASEPSTWLSTMASETAKASACAEVSTALSLVTASSAAANDSSSATSSSRGVRAAADAGAPDSSCAAIAGVGGLRRASSARCVVSSSAMS